MKEKGRLDERLLQPMNGFSMLFIQLFLFVISVGFFVMGVIKLTQEGFTILWLLVTIGTACYYSIVFPIFCCGFKVIHPNEAGVYTLFGSYYGTINTAGFYWINPFCMLFNPSARVNPANSTASTTTTISSGSALVSTSNPFAVNKKVSLKATTLDNERQKINDMEGNPIDIGVVVIWRVVSATKAVFEVDNYNEYLSVQCDAALRNVARQYPYDVSDDEGEEKSLRGSSQQIAEELRKELQNRVSFAGLEVIETRISHLAYAQEIAAAMLQRQQAAAVIAAKQKIVDGAVGMVEMALGKLSERNVVTLDEERKAAMVSNLLVVLCGSKDAQPVVNSGSIY